MTPPFDRRRFLKSLGLGLAAVTAPGCGETSSGVALAEPVDFPLGLDLPFAHGVRRQPFGYVLLHRGLHSPV